MDDVYSFQIVSKILDSYLKIMIKNGFMRIYPVEVKDSLSSNFGLALIIQKELYDITKNHLKTSNKSNNLNE